MESTKKVLIPENDARFVIQTADKVDCNSNLFKWVHCNIILPWNNTCTNQRFINPDGDPSQCPIQLEGVRKMPKFVPGITQQLRSAIPFAKHAAPVEVFSRDGIVASIMTGECPSMTAAVWFNLCLKIIPQRHHMDGGELAWAAEVLRPQSLLQQQGTDWGVEGGGRHGDLSWEVAQCFPQSVRSSDRGSQAVQHIFSVM